MRKPLPSIGLVAKVRRTPHISFNLTHSVLGVNDSGLARINVANRTDSSDDHYSVDLEARKPAELPISVHKRAFVTSVEDEGRSERSIKHARFGEDGTCIERGRTSNRKPRLSNPLAVAESRPHREESTIKIDGRPIEKRGLSRSSTFFEDPNDPCAILEDSLLEPCPQIPLSDTVDEVLNGGPSPTALISGRMKSHSLTTPNRKLSWTDLGRPARALTTVFNNCQLQSPSPLPTISAKNLSQRATYANQLEEMTKVSPSTLTSTSSADSSSPGNSTGLASPLAQNLPTEIVQQIFKHLPHADFNSARHSCRLWFIHSLNEALLETMLRRGGFASCLINDMPKACSDGSGFETNKIWLMSKRLSRECALGPDWLGNGLTNLRVKSEKPSGFVNVTSVDFTEVAVHYPGPDSAGTVFTISTCGRFLMAANGCLVYVYELNRHHRIEDGAIPSRSGYLLPVTSIICPRRVLACSMDTSSHRYAIAILLDGRMGLVCDITTIPRHSSSTNTPECSTSMRNLPGSRTSGQKFLESAGMKGATFLDRVSLNGSSSAVHSDRVISDPSFVFPGIATHGTLSAPVGQSEWQDVFQDDIPRTSRTVGTSSRHTSLPRAFIVSRNERAQEFSASPQGTESASNLRVEEGPRSLYRHLCSDDDPPRSVAICPQRRCVAFGCSSGIELHWVDALTGQDLNRWFPLTAPSDFLFFLPPRKSIDSAKKLRLISSAARPNERPAISDRSFGTQTWGNPLWERFGWGVNHYIEGDDVSSAQGILTRLRIDTSRTSLTGRMDCSDHYRAIPISDGYHILFTDPSTGLLCLGSDAPVGGPTKLLRKIWFKGPQGEGPPIVYAGGSDLSWGVRVVAGFGTGSEQSIWLFSVPNDIFTANQNTQPSSSPPPWFSPNSSREAQNLDWIKWWPEDGLLQEWLNHVQDPVPGILPRSIWPVKIRGQKIGTCTGLVDLVIDSGPQMTIWAFGKGGVATVWKLDDGRHEGVRNIWVQRDGTVRQGDSDGDIEMTDVSLNSPNAVGTPPRFQQQSFDGTSTPSTVVTTRCERRHHIKWTQHMIRYDVEGDVLMDEVRYPEASAVVEGESSEEIAWNDVHEMVRHERAWWISSYHRLNMRDIVEEMAGIARIDVEIH